MCYLGISKSGNCRVFGSVADAIKNKKRLNLASIIGPFKSCDHAKKCCRVLTRLPGNLTIAQIKTLCTVIQ